MNNRTHFKGLFRAGGGIVIFLVFLLWFWFCSFPATGNSGGGKRGDAPHCQEECLKRHSGKMKQLAAKYEKGLNVMAYQDKVEEEALHYSGCLDECRAVQPVK
ncbi:MAG TPA: hypothetical protein VGJ94_19140 [Syntrophorhabdaceae bacterium]